MPEVHELAELAPRDVVSRAIVRQLAAQGGAHVWLDCRHVEGFASRFPGIAALLQRFELDPRSDLIPVHPAAHYSVGGVRVDAEGRSSLPGLFAVGEASCSGLHGANRLASNSLLEGLVLGEAAGRIAGLGREPFGNPTRIVSDIPPSGHGELDLSDVRSSLRSAMWRNVGIERTGEKLRDAVEMFDFWGRYTLDKIFDEPAGWETQNMLLVGALIARSALWREESRGCHARRDFPDPRPEFLVHDGWVRGADAPLSEPVLGAAAPAPEGAP
jgi:L-aspartate oxidase